MTSKFTEWNVDAENRLSDLYKLRRETNLRFTNEQYQEVRELGELHDNYLLKRFSPILSWLTIRLFEIDPAKLSKLNDGKNTDEYFSEACLIMQTICVLKEVDVHEISDIMIDIFVRMFFKSNINGATNKEKQKLNYTIAYGKDFDQLAQELVNRKEMWLGK